MLLNLWHDLSGKAGKEMEFEGPSINQTPNFRS
jgi:hypothetical protein